MVQIHLAKILGKQNKMKILHKWTVGKGRKKEKKKISLLKSQVTLSPGYGWGKESCYTEGCGGYQRLAMLPTLWQSWGTAASCSLCTPFSQVSWGQANRRWGHLTATANATEGSASLDLLTSGFCQTTSSPGVIFSQKSSWIAVNLQYAN